MRRISSRLEAESDASRTQFSTHNLPQRCAEQKMLERHSTSAASNGIHAAIIPRTVCLIPRSNRGFFAALYAQKMSHKALQFALVLYILDLPKELKGRL